MTNTSFLQHTVKAISKSKFCFIPSSNSTLQFYILLASADPWQWKAKIAIRNAYSDGKSLPNFGIKCLRVEVLVLWVKHGQDCLTKWIEWDDMIQSGAITEISSTILGLKISYNSFE